MRFIKILPLLAVLLCTDVSYSQANKKPAGVISQFERAGQSDFLIDKNNVYHVVFQESPDYGKPIFIYYSSSANQGTTWSKPITLSNDNSGNGSGPPQLLQDASGVVYAFWKRYGNNGSKYPVTDVILDGRGGYSNGTLFYRALRGGQWGEPVQVSETTGSQFSWFATLNKEGQPVIYWNQVSDESLKNNWVTWYYADWLRGAALTPSAVAGRVTLNEPSKPSYAGGAPEHLGMINLHGYVAADGNMHLIFTRNDKKIHTLWYFDGKQYKTVYEYPLYKEGNTFMNPPRLLYDEKGNDHIILRPSSEVLESEQVWDITPADGKKNILADIQVKGVKIWGIQANQGAGGKMAVMIQAGNTQAEAYGSFYANGKWERRALTKNAAKESFVYKDLTAYTYLATLTQYSSTHISVAWGPDGKKKMAHTLTAKWMGGGYSVSNPTLLFSKID